MWRCWVESSWVGLKQLRREITTERTDRPPSSNFHFTGVKRSERAGTVLLEHQWMQKMQRMHADFFQGAVVRQWAIAEKNITSLCHSRKFSKSWMGWISVFKFYNPICVPIYPKYHLLKESLLLEQWFERKVSFIQQRFWGFSVTTLIQLFALMKRTTGKTRELD